MSPSFITKVDEIMKGRSGKLVIEARTVGMQLQDIKYDRNKIVFDYSRKSLCSLVFVTRLLDLKLNFMYH